MSKANPTLWGMYDDERLSCTSIGERVVQFCDDHEDDDPLPETITVVGYDPMKINTKNMAENILERLLEDLDEDCADPDGDNTKPTEAMKKAADEFIEKIVAEYHVWNCEGVCEKTVRIKDYVSDEDLKERGIGI